MNRFRSHSRHRHEAPGPPGPGRLAALVMGAVLLLALPGPDAARGDEGLLRAPRKGVRAEARPGDAAGAQRGVLETIFAAPVLFYQHYLGPSWGQRCSYHPSCSNYALQAIDRHGALLGSIMTFDRLQHEADESRHAPRILTGGEIRFSDPLVNNDYWWYRPDRPGPPVPAAADGTAHP